MDAVPLCLRTRDADEIVRTVKLMEPSFGGINLEDIAQPKCFGILDRLRDVLAIPVWHDDQQGTATVLLAALMNALKLVGKELGEVRIAMVGAGAANVAAFRLLTAAGVDPKGIVVCDSGGILHAKRRVSRAWSEAKPCSTKKPAWPSATRATRRRSWQTLFHAEESFLELGAYAKFYRVKPRVASVRRESE